MQHGRYSSYLRPYIELFGRPPVHIGFYEDLKRDPRAFMVSICRSVDIDETYFNNYRFGIVNKGLDVRNRYLHKIYIQTKEQFRKLVRRAPALRAQLKRVRLSTNAANEKLNVHRDRPVTMSDATMGWLLSYYADEPINLRQMVGLEAPWPSQPLRTRELDLRER